ncbi:malonyl CoA-ACP transacylase [Alkalimonas amylolytica]|uniref:[acyl-carrier-protein] S-malonyltransferase n=1 Tax=Alkalimonas amylolytica TaxID=152573 RepID=A0A1H4F5W2_ALKAM|nr:malonyl CoA-ACP transacylase [Alkalimonas amylolytica]SEA92649.1 Malonyl CoA-acyl carrier protein transacylase [Alkalimonas amylolytica]
MKKTAVVVCPGRGSYNKPELGSIGRLHGDKTALLTELDKVRAELGLAGIRELDGAGHYASRVHQQAENAAGLIFSAGLLDYQSINQAEFDVVAITGNSMGWYTALGCAGVWHPAAAMQYVCQMAKLTAGAAGGQCIYPLVNSDWQPDADKIALVDVLLADYAGELFESIRFGGYAVLAGSEAAMQAVLRRLPRVDERFPLLLPGHAAFHSPLMADAASKAMAAIPASAFARPELPLIDGCGRIWQPFATEAAALKHYTLDRQVQGCYDFSLAIEVAVKEFAPDVLILLGPGSSLGGAVAQSLIRLNWQGLGSKADFSARQQQSPLLLSMGLSEQRSLVL